jgi:hypothetical protein
MWIVGALVVGALGGAAAVASQSVTLSGDLAATDQERDEGYFALGPDAMLAVKPGSSLHDWLRGRTGTRVRLTIEASPSSD